MVKVRFWLVLGLKLGLVLGLGLRLGPKLREHIFLLVAKVFNDMFK